MPCPNRILPTDVGVEENICPECFHLTQLHDLLYWGILFPQCICFLDRLRLKKPSYKKWKRVFSLAVRKIIRSFPPVFGVPPPLNLDPFSCFQWARLKESNQVSPEINDTASSRETIP